MKELQKNNENFSEEYMQLMKEYYNKLINDPNKNPASGINQPDEEGELIITNSICLC